MKKWSYKLFVKLGYFFLEYKFDEFENKDDWLIFLGFSLIGNMGFLEWLGFMLKVFKVVLEVIDSLVIFFIVGYLFFDFEVIELCDENFLI